VATVTKKDLARAVADSISCKNNLTLQMVDSLFEAMRETLIEGNRIEIRGFGVLEVKNTKPKPAARNPRTGEVVYVPARRKTHFKPGKQLKEALHSIRPDAASENAPPNTATSSAVPTPPAPTPTAPSVPSSDSGTSSGSTWNS
jgi:integration host factor subunit beta